MKNRLGTYLIGPKWRFWKTNFLDISQKKFAAYAQSPWKCSNIEILAKIEGKEVKVFLKICEGHIRIWFRSKKNSKLSHACVPLMPNWSVRTEKTSAGFFGFILMASTVHRVQIHRLVCLDGWNTSAVLLAPRFYIHQVTFNLNV